MADISSQTNQTTKGNSSPSEGTGSPGFIRGVAGGILLSSLYGMWRGKDATSEAPSLATPFGSRSHQFITSQEALDAFRSGKFHRSVEEISSFDGTGSIFVFQSTANPQETSILRGIETRTERVDFIQALKSLGAEVPGIIVNTNAHATIQAPRPAHREAWYEPFLFPGALVLASFIAARGFIGGFGKLGSIISRKLGEDEIAKLSQFSERPEARFADFGGNQHPIAEIKDLVNDIRDVQRGIDRELPRGVLIHGKPGVGKSFIGEIIAGEADCPYFYIVGSELLNSPYQGDRPKAVQDLFKQLIKARNEGTKKLRAEEHATGLERQPIVCVVDEFDGAGKARSGQGGEHGNGEHDLAVNAWLSYLQGIDSELTKDIIIVGTTNNLQQIDPALLRPGRFEIQIEVKEPETTQERLDVLQKVSIKILPRYQLKLSDPEVLAELATITATLSPDHLRGLVKMAAKKVQREGRDFLTSVDLYEAYQVSSFGPSQPGLTSLEKLELVACHEDGHGLLAIAVGLNPLVRSYVPRGNSLGRVVIDAGPLNDPPMTREDVLKQMLISAGGRAGELIGKDLNHATIGVMGKDQSDYAVLSRLAKVFLSSGMLDGSYGGYLEDTSEFQMPDNIRLQIEKLADRAIEHAVKILQELKPDTFSKIVRSGVAGAHEEVGSAAKLSYVMLLEPEELLAIQRKAREFYANSDPLELSLTPE